MTGHSSPKVVQYRTVRFPPVTQKVDAMADAATEHEVGSHVSLQVIYLGMAEGLAVVHIHGYGNYAVEQSRLRPESV